MTIDLRTIERRSDDGKWVECLMADIKKGDVFRFYEGPYTAAEDATQTEFDGVWGVEVDICIQATDITFEDAMQRESDMELIAAAPELLKALKAVAALEVEPGEILTGRELTNAVAAAKASISKATGVTP